MTGMRNRMSVARCCCDCEDCCNGAYPTEWDAAFTIGDAACTSCDEFIDGTYNLTFTGGLYTSLQTCSWGYYWVNPVTYEPCIANAPQYSYWGLVWNERFLKFRVTCITATQYRIQAVLGISVIDMAGFAVGSAQRFDFERYVDVADWTCDTVTDYCIPLSYWSVGYLGADFWSGSGFRTWTGFADPYRKLCEPPTEICLTAIP